MSNVPTDLRYTKSHEWLRSLADGTLEIGITDHAQHTLGDLVFVEVPQAGRQVRSGEACAVVESVNAQPYGAGWLMRLRPAPGALAAAQLLSPADYEKVLAAEES